MLKWLAPDLMLGLLITKDRLVDYKNRSMVAGCITHFHHSLFNVASLLVMRVLRHHSDFGKVRNPIIGCRQY